MRRCIESPNYGKTFRILAVGEDRYEAEWSDGMFGTGSLEWAERMPLVGNVCPEGYTRGEGWCQCPEPAERDLVADPRVGDLWQWAEGQQTARVTLVLPDPERRIFGPRITLEGRDGPASAGWWQGQGWSPARDGGAR